MQANITAKLLKELIICHLSNVHTKIFECIKNEIKEGNLRYKYLFLVSTFIPDSTILQFTKEFHDSAMDDISKIGFPRLILSYITITDQVVYVHFNFAKLLFVEKYEETSPDLERKALELVKIISDTSHYKKAVRKAENIFTDIIKNKIIHQKKSCINYYFRIFTFTDWIIMPITSMLTIQTITCAKLNNLFAVHKQIEPNFSCDVLKIKHTMSENDTTYDIMIAVSKQLSVY